MLGATFDTNLCLELKKAKKNPGCCVAEKYAWCGVRYKSMLGSALDKKIHLERHQLKKSWVLRLTNKCFKQR